MTTTRPLTLGRAWDLADRCAAVIRQAHSSIVEVEPAGDLRRALSLIASLSFVAVSDAPDRAIASISEVLENPEAGSTGQRQLSGRFEQLPVDVYIAAPAERGLVLFTATGSTDHVRGVLARGASDRPYATEADLYASAGLPFIPPELRNGGREIDRALAMGVPRLLETADLRGDLHMHTDFSDGRDPLAVMVAGCDALGYEYIAITDHSPGANTSRTLVPESVARQREEIDRLREQYPRLTILHGCEVDILPDGGLDLPDAALETFDIILTSLHQRAGQNGAQLTGRSLRAIRHPLVNVLCHPSNQLVGSSPPYPLDFDALYAAAAETGTALEIDGAPSHLDLDGEHAEAAVAAGVTLTVDSDCHRVEALGRQMSFGTGLARRGWVEPRHVLNTRPLADVRAFIAAKRRGRPGTAG